MIKFLDLAAQNAEIMPEVQERFAKIHESASYIDGPPVSEFEKEFAAFLGARHAVGVGSGTDALRLALMAIGVGAGDEVITVPSSFIATAAAIIQTGATVTFVDIDPETGSMDPLALSDYLAARKFKSPNGPRAIVPVHLYGLPAGLSEVCEIGRFHEIPVVEDSCQAHGSRIRMSTGWRMAGTIGEAGCFSFYPGKNLGAWGEAGAVVTNDQRVAERVLRLRNHGRMSHFAHQECGYNARLDTMQAAVLSAKLKRLDTWNARRRELAVLYNSHLSGSGVEIPSETNGLESNYHLYVIRSTQRDAIRQALLAEGIDCGIHYPVPLPLQPALRSLNYAVGDFPRSERWADSILSLPMHPHMTVEQVAQVSSVVKACIRPEVKSSADANKNAERVESATE
ncbi:MAG TPA: DegT/DnrJ/EryC1/StrS family aminotransferase [Candidatus Binataceae bacterium]|nr:DegT/DnrJ/EryC1/StrS family aminotransferase [Candidatus Binataceae bacterium]